jgi:nucleotide-binding universal stress UspA family protein
MKSAAAPHLGTLPGLPPVVYEGRTGPLLDELLEAVAEHRADLALIGHRQDHPLRRSLARRLAKLAPCSVWLVPNGSPAAVTRVLVPIDFSPTAGHALGTATALAPRVGLSGVTAVHVYFDESRTTYEGADDVVRGREEEAFAAFVAPLGTTAVSITPLFRESVSPSHAIREVADEIAADLVVMGTRGRSRSAAVLLGSVAQETLIESRVPVLVVKTPGRQVGVFRALLERLARHDPGAQFD